MEASKLFHKICNLFQFFLRGHKYAFILFFSIPQTQHTQLFFECDVTISQKRDRSVPPTGGGV
jgi:hypothetical protein